MPLTGKGTVPSSGFRHNDGGSSTRLLIVLLAISVALFTIDSRQGQTGALEFVRGGFQTVMTPLRQLSALIFAPFGNVGNIALNLTASQESLSDLQAEIEDLRAENATLAESAQLTERLEGLLQLRNTYSLRSTGARIIAGASDSWSSTVTIDKGAAAGIAVGMPVADAHGAIGQVIEVSATTAVVRLLTDENSGISAMVQETRAQGQLRGSAAGTLRLTLIRTDQTVEVGDVIVTSGLGGVFPKGLPIGRVTSVEKSPGALYYDISVDPLAPVESFEEVLVITSLTEEQQATANDIAEADAQETSKTSGSESPQATEEGTEDSSTENLDSSEEQE